MNEVLHVNGSTARERHNVTAAVDAVLQSCGAAVVDYHQFSNVSVSVTFEIPAGKLAELKTELENAGITLSQNSLDDLRRFGHSAPESEITGTVQITFYHHEPDPPKGAYAKLHA